MRLRSGTDTFRNNFDLPIMNTNTSFTTSLTYPFPTLTKITGKPTAVSMKLLTKELFTNARAIPCHQAGGRYGHLGIIMPDVPYQALAGVTAAWDDVAAPGDAPNIPGGSDSVTIANTIKQHEQNVHRFTLAQTVDNDLKSQLIAAVEPQYISSLEDEMLGFATVTARTIFHHLKDTYGVAETYRDTTVIRRLI